MTVTADKETRSFQTEVKQLLHLMVHSLYSNKEIFLRELISNASDAIDKLRFKALSDSSLLGSDTDLHVRISVDKDAGTLTVSDNGIGMSRDEIIKHLGTIAKSGTAEFLGQLTGDQKKDSQLIGQFGVGFYSAFIVADKVTVRSRAAGTDSEAGVQWESSGDGQYELQTIDKETRGTDVILHLKEGEKEFLDDWRLRSVINKYSDHISVPVEMEKQVEVDAEEQDGEEKKADQEKAQATEFERINKATALWTRPKSDISDEEYKEFYKHVSHDFGDPLTWSHNKVEGTQEYTSLLYIPQKAPFDMWNRDRVRGVKLYVQRVFIMDDAEQFLPVYLRFVRGVLDSNDLPLNVSREILQDSKTTESLRKACVNRVLGTLQDLAKSDSEKYQTFWNEFGQVLKEGVAEDFANRDRLAKLMRFSSTHTDKPEQTVSLDDYIARMKPEQEAIYYITADTFATAKNSPHLEVFRKKGIEVLLMHDRIDEWMMSYLPEYEGKTFKSVAQGSLDLGKLDTEEDKKAQEDLAKEHEPLVKRVKDALGEQVKEVRVTTRLTDSPACIVVDEGDMAPHMARLMKAAGQPVPESKPIFEVNPEHVLVKRLIDQQGEQFNDLTHVLFDQAVLAESGQLDDPSTFASRLNKLLVSLSN